MFLRGAKGHQEDSHVSVLALEMTDVCSGGKGVLRGSQAGVGWAGCGWVVRVLYYVVLPSEYLKITPKTVVK